MQVDLCGRYFDMQSCGLLRGRENFFCIDAGIHFAQIWAILHRGGPFCTEAGIRKMRDTTTKTRRRKNASGAGLSVLIAFSEESRLSETAYFSSGCTAAARAFCWASASARSLPRVVKYVLIFGSVPEGRTTTLAPPSRV